MRIKPKKFIIAYFLVIQLFLLNSEGKSISEQGSYVNFCKKASEDPTTFANFKRHPIYRCILEHVTYEQGWGYINIIAKQNKEFFNIKDISDNDKLGNPVKYFYKGYGTFSPTTLQYIKVSSDLKHHFGNLKELRIIEIGGGYGGQCKVLKDLCGFKNYTIIDLPEPLELTKKYLNLCNIKNVKYLTPDQLDLLEEYDLVISNYAFSEISRDDQLIYMNKLISKVSKGYMTINFINKFFGIKAMSKEELLKTMQKANLKIREYPEEPITNEGNFILIWK